MRLFKKKKKNTISRNVSGGGANKAAFSYYGNRSQQDQGKSSEPKRSKTSDGRFLSNIKLGLVIFIFFAVIGLIVTLNKEPSIEIINKDKQASSIGGRSSEEYQAIVNQIFSQTPLNRTKITISSEEIEKSLLEALPEATDISVVLPVISRTPIVYVRVAEPVSNLRVGKNIFLIDEKGRALKQIEKANPGLLSIVDKSGLSVEVGKQIIPQAHLQFIKEVQRQLKEKNITVSSATLTELPNELHVSIEGKKYIAKFNLVGDPRLQSGTLIASQKELDRKGIAPSSYIDVRVEERAYYK